MAGIIAETQYLAAGFVWLENCSNFVHIKVKAMKKALALVLLAALIASCSSYTCPTYSKKEVKKEVKETKI
jgi:hypothetical protein